MDKLILKITTRGERVGAVYKHGDAKSLNGELLIGRAYDNDVIVDDSFVAAHQFRIRVEDSGVKVEIIDPVNPIFINGRLIETPSRMAKIGDIVSVGRTQIALLTEHSEVAPTRQQFVSSWSRAGKISPVLALIALLVYSGTESFATFFQTSTDLEWREPAYMTLFSAATLFVWAGVWALAGRLLKHQSLFFVQLFLTAVISGAFIFVSPIAEYIDFNANDTTAGEIANYVIGFLFLVVLLKINLSVATNLQNSTQAAVLSGLFLFGLTFAGVRYYEGEFSQEQVYPSTIKPPFAVTRSPISIDDYFTELQQLEHDDLIE